MRGSADLSRLPHLCASISNEISDEDGFVPVRSLLRRFQARLVVRPLLVEAMLASVAEGNGSDIDSTRWTVLVDRDTHPVSDDDVQVEAKGKALSPRFRNTVAHELVHSIAFRPGAFGVDLRVERDADYSAFVDQIEAVTEKLSPLLLISDKALRRLIDDAERPLSVEDFAHIARAMGVSREVLVSRLSSIPLGDEHRFRQSVALRNQALVVGEWIDGQQAVLRSWPQFWNFDRNIVPAFVLGLNKHDRIPIASFCSDSAFEGCGGWREWVEFEVKAGVVGAPDSHSMRIRISMERAERRPRAQFLFAVHKIA